MHQARWYATDDLPSHFTVRSMWRQVRSSEVSDAAFKFQTNRRYNLSSPWCYERLYSGTSTQLSDWVACSLDEIIPQTRLLGCP